MKKILIVDDSMSIRQCFIDILSPVAECEEAVNGQEGIDRVRETLENGGRYDLVLMDIIMPGKDGLTAVSEVREIEKSLGRDDEARQAIIIVTTIKDPSRILIAQYDCGADGYIAKPFTKKTVFQTLRSNGLNTGRRQYEYGAGRDQRQWSYS